ncbi:MAG: hypothetical protein HY707_01685 [Ignavibacteriae bacterium]|nr:hypothetical protein [Ignavibacteriota bacterium]
MIDLSNDIAYQESVRELPNASPVILSRLWRDCSESEHGNLSTDADLKSRSAGWHQRRSRVGMTGGHGFRTDSTTPPYGRRLSTRP